MTCSGKQKVTLFVTVVEQDTVHKHNQSSLIMFHKNVFAKSSLKQTSKLRFDIFHAKWLQIKQLAQGSEDTVTKAMSDVTLLLGVYLASVHTDLVFCRYGKFGCCCCFCLFSVSESVLYFFQTKFQCEKHF